MNFDILCARFWSNFIFFVFVWLIFSYFIKSNKNNININLLRNYKYFQRLFNYSLKRIQIEYSKISEVIRL